MEIKFNDGEEDFIISSKVTFLLCISNFCSYSIWKQINDEIYN